MTQATVLFGIGAAKAGTTWLYRYLASHPEARLPAVKELHYFDTCETGKFDRQTARLEKERDRRQNRLPVQDEGLRKRLWREIRGYNQWLDVIRDGQDDAAYLAYLNETAGPAKLTADITPAYATLSAESLTRMQALSPMTRFVFLMRDPLDRLWSNIRMAAARQSEDMASRAATLLDKVLAGEDATITARSDYAGTLARINKALDPKRVFLSFYETLFQPDTLDRLCRFLGLSAHPARTEARVLPGETLEMTELQRTRALNWLAPQYDAVARAMGPLPTRWTDNMEALA